MAFMRQRPAPDVAGYPTPERVALAHAIAGHAAAIAHVVATDEAGNRASQAVWDAQAAVTAAHEGVGEARDASVQHMIAAAGGDTGPAPRTERQARDALADAEAALDAARSARDALKGRLPDAERERDIAARRRTEAARAVIAAETADHAAALAVEVESLQRNALAKGAALARLAKARAVETVQQPGMEYGRPADPAIRAALYRHDLVMQFAVTPDGWHHASAQAGAAPWDAALAALERDAAAVLPLGSV